VRVRGGISSRLSVRLRQRCGCGLRSSLAKAETAMSVRRQNGPATSVWDGFSERLLESQRVGWVYLGRPISGNQGSAEGC
jgi:hypothetical protein